MTEIGEVESEVSVRTNRQNFTHLGHTAGGAVSCQPHDLVFVPVVEKAEILRQRLVEDAQRVWEKYPVGDLDFRFAPDTPGGAREITGAIDRHHRGFLKRRHVK